jgi:hypothetical protein
MSLLTASPTTADRAQIMAEAVVSAYINEISPTERQRERVGRRRTRVRPYSLALRAKPGMTAAAALAGRSLTSEPRSFALSTCTPTSRGAR